MCDSEVKADLEEDFGLQFDGEILCGPCSTNDKDLYVFVYQKPSKRPTLALQVCVSNYGLRPLH